MILAQFTSIVATNMSSMSIINTQEQSFKASLKIIVQQLVVTCIKLIITKQIMTLVTF
jgi:hypothetical protein